MPMGGGGGGRRSGRLTRAELKEQKIQWSMVRGVFGLARPWKWSLLAFALLAMAAAFVGTAPTLVIRKIIDEGIPNKDVREVVVLCFVTIGLYLLQRWASSRVGSGITFMMRVRIYDHVQRQPLSFFTATQTGALMSRVSNDVTGAQQILTDVVSTLTTNAFTFLSTVAVMFALDWQLTLVVLLAVPAFLIPAKYMARVMQRMTRERMDLAADMNAFLHERLNVSGATLSHLYGDKLEERRLYDAKAAAVRDLGVKTALTAGIYGLATSMFATMSTSMVYWFGGWRAITGGLTVGTIVSFGVLAQRAYTPVNSMTNVRIDLATALVSFERVFEVLDFANPIVEAPDAVDLADDVAGDVELDGVAFAYPPASEATLLSLENPALSAGRRSVPRAGSDSGSGEAGSLVLSDVSFHARPGELVALVGPTGAGKTTTLHLVPRLADVSGGAVRIDGIDVRRLTLRSLRRAVGVVSQDSHLFHDTLRNNLRYAKPDATDEELVRACTIARIHDLIAGLPEGYDTVAGERGYRMSGGEKQRLAIARMILKDPAIVILDEATAHLDSRNERLIQEALADALRGRTTLVIAHRLSTIVEADKVVVLDQGRVVQVGTHDELSAAPGLYQELAAAQFGASVVGGIR